MFTGIVEERGEITARDDLTEAARFRIRGALVTSDASFGDSIAVNGVCLTVTELADDEFTVDVMAETLKRSSLDRLGAGATVNLERAMAAGGRFGGHIVQGHVDGVGEIRAVSPSENWTVARVAVPAHLARYVVEKGSITIDGISLTVSAVGVDREYGDWLEVSLIPTTLAETNLGDAAPGVRVNLEVDVIAKYVERLTGAGRTANADVEGSEPNE
ncbi:riboflavin synthase [Gordonia phthalatica]|uniref:Riboflavin synthase n=1 Tax=Gordonia phthalatica TaxID=1136941 RepID=A0A0N9NB01_9ACTN|nr:riboflavin synthase [Gordonia phthalatica]ALG84753.1 riboflavin synthase subunit alpha [Gordonia phthalatica]